MGDDIDVYVLNTDDDETGQIILSKKRADFEKAWDRVIEAQQRGDKLQAMVTERVKGGMVVDIGIRGFVPASHVGTGKARNLEKYVGTILLLKVIEVDRDRRKVVLSHRLATEEEREALRKETLESLSEGQVRQGVVRRITDYGAFVDIGGVDGLLHISEMSGTRIKHPNDVLKVGDEIQVMVLKTNLEQGRISLGLRQILPDPGTLAQEKFTPGDIISGTVTRLMPYGVFVQVEGPLEGIVPNGELSTRRVSKPEEVVTVGDTVEVKVVEVRADERRMTLSIRQAMEERGDYGEYVPDPSGCAPPGDVELLSHLPNEYERTRTSLPGTIDRSAELVLESDSPSFGSPEYLSPVFAMGTPRIADLDKALALAAELEDTSTTRSSDRHR